MLVYVVLPMVLWVLAGSPNGVVFVCVCVLLCVLVRGPQLSCAPGRDTLQIIKCQSAAAVQRHYSVYYLEHIQSEKSECSCTVESHSCIVRD